MDLRTAMVEHFADQVSALEEAVIHAGRGLGDVDLGPVTIRSRPLEAEVPRGQPRWMTDDAAAAEVPWAAFFKRLIELVVALGGRAEWPDVGVFEAKKEPYTIVTGAFRVRVSFSVTLTWDGPPAEALGLWAFFPAARRYERTGVKLTLDDGRLIGVHAHGQPWSEIEEALRHPTSAALRVLDVSGVEPETMLALDLPDLERLHLEGSLRGDQVPLFKQRFPELIHLQVGCTPCIDLAERCSVQHGRLHDPWSSRTIPSGELSIARAHPSWAEVRDLTMDQATMADLVALVQVPPPRMRTLILRGRVPDRASDLLTSHLHTARVLGLPPVPPEPFEERFEPPEVLDVIASDFKRIGSDLMLSEVLVVVRRLGREVASLTGCCPPALPRISRDHLQTNIEWARATTVDRAVHATALTAYRQALEAIDEGWFGGAFGADYAVGLVEALHLLPWLAGQHPGDPMRREAEITWCQERIARMLALEDRLTH